MNEQEKFWAKTYANEYIQKNSEFDLTGGVTVWKKILTSTQNINSVLECGCNIGKNINFLNHVLPDAQKSIIELSQPAFQFVVDNYDLNQYQNSSIVDSNLKTKFDLVFTMGVLIHIHPDDLLANIEKIISYSSNYVLVGEYFNRTAVTIEYQGETKKLFKSDFGKTILDNFNVQLVDYGFLWGHIYDRSGFDDITWWLFSVNK